jgi:predicted DNA-binding transcriptional regulator AlpA
LSIKEVSNIIGISVSTINRVVDKGTLAPKHKLSAQRIGFLKYQVDQWIDGKRTDW